MNAVTLYPPWPWAITHGEKRIENRGWAPSEPSLVRGDELAIHAAARQRFDDEAVGYFEELQGQGLGGFREPVPHEGFAASAVVAVVRYWGFITKCPSPESSQGVWWVPGTKCGWVFDEMTCLPSPVACRGRQKRWQVPLEVEELVEEQMAKATVRWTTEGWDIDP